MSELGTIVYFVIAGILLLIGAIFYIHHVRDISPNKSISYSFTPEEYHSYNELTESAINNTTLMFNPTDLSNEQKHDNYTKVYCRGAELMKEDGVYIPSLENRNHG